MSARDKDRVRLINPFPNLNVSPTHPLKQLALGNLKSILSQHLNHTQILSFKKHTQQKLQSKR